MCMCVYVYVCVCIYSLCVCVYTHTHFTSVWAGCELHEVVLACCGVVNIDPLGKIPLLCVLIQYVIYLLQLGLHPVAVVFTLVQYTRGKNRICIRRTITNHITHKTKHIKQHNKI